MYGVLGGHSAVSIDAYVSVGQSVLELIRHQRACSQALISFCNCLSCSGADKGLKNADEKTAFEVAELNEQEDVMALLK
jgi:hypothetical protein